MALTLYKGEGTEVTGFVPTWTDNGDNTWSYSYAGLPKYESDGTTISYYVTETPVTGYATTYSGDGCAPDGGTITNTLTEVPTTPTTTTTTTTRVSRVIVAKGLPNTGDPAGTAGAAALAALGAALAVAGLRRRHEGEDGV